MVGPMTLRVTLCHVCQQKRLLPRWTVSPSPRFLVPSFCLTSMAPSRWEAYCPNCRMKFRDPSAVIQHLNHPYSSCARWFISSHTPIDSPLSPAPNYPSTSMPENSGGTSIKFPFAGRVFNRSGGFMGEFHIDKFSEERAQNSFYPFSSKGEWQLVAFLSRSGLSMKFIDEFLSLDLVSEIIVTSSLWLTSP